KQIVGAPDIERAIKLVRQQIDEEHLAFLPYRRKPVSIGNAGARHQEWTPTVVGVEITCWREGLDTFACLLAIPAKAGIHRATVRWTQPPDQVRGFVGVESLAVRRGRATRATGRRRKSK